MKLNGALFIYSTIASSSNASLHSCSRPLSLPDSNTPMLPPAGPWIDMSITGVPKREILHPKRARGAHARRCVLPDKPLAFINLSPDAGHAVRRLVAARAALDACDIVEGILIEKHSIAVAGWAGTKGRAQALCRHRRSRNTWVIDRRAWRCSGNRRRRSSSAIKIGSGDRDGVSAGLALSLRGGHGHSWLWYDRGASTRDGAIRTSRKRRGGGVRVRELSCSSGLWRAFVDRMGRPTVKRRL